jgi:lysophospholipase L1-like esterase
MNRSTGLKALYAVAAVPLGAAFQGYYFLSTYRREHGDAPFPISPSSGVVVVQNKENTRVTDKPRAHRFWREAKGRDDSLKDRPLRLLVVGDSLAAGVGITQSGMPILPESIAKSLSLELGGRPVYWTCVGTPGASTRRIIADIESFHKQQEETQDKHIKPRWSPVAWLNILQTFTTSHINPTIPCDPLPMLATSHSNEIEQNKYSILQHFRKYIKGKVQTIVDKLKQLKNRDDDDMKWKIWRDSLRASDAHYDVVVVLTGMNDFKSIFLPFLTDIGYRNDAKFSDELQRLLDTLKKKMKLQPKKEESLSRIEPLSHHTTHDTHRSQDHNDGPISPSKFDKAIIVLPAIPTNPINFLRYPPLSWLAFPLFQMLEAQKRSLALENPGSILFVEEPTMEIIEEIEAGRGILHAKKRTEEVIFRITDLSRKAKAKVEAVMAHRLELLKSKLHCDEVTERKFEEAFYTQTATDFSGNQKTIGSSLISHDRLHPNEFGYEFYGRHIAAAIIVELGRQ